MALGLGTIDCIKHNFMHGQGVGDLQRGKRYVTQQTQVVMILIDIVDM